MTASVRLTAGYRLDGIDLSVRYGRAWASGMLGYARQPQAALFGMQLGYYEVAGGRIIGMLLSDFADG